MVSVPAATVKKFKFLKSRIPGSVTLEGDFRNSYGKMDLNFNVTLDKLGPGYSHSTFRKPAVGSGSFTQQAMHRRVFTVHLEISMSHPSERES